MLRQRIIFSLIYDRGSFTQSRNFRLQKVGDINWLEKNYQFQKISFSLDELIVLDASRGGKDAAGFAAAVSRLVEDVFIPVAAGGGIRRAEDAARLFNSGADKIVLNSALHENPALVRELAATYGAQSIVASIDYKVLDGKPAVYINDGSRKLETPLSDYIGYVQGLDVGEIYLNSIDKDGTGFGYDLPVIAKAAAGVRLPLIIAGGAGNESHLIEGLRLPNVSAVATANLFNFVGDGLPKARRRIVAAGENVADWRDNFSAGGAAPQPAQGQVKDL